MDDHAVHEDDAKPLNKLRHSSAHVLAAAVTELFPGVKCAFGPWVENGFYYDFEFPLPVGEGELPRIQKRMYELINRRIPFEPVRLPREEAIARFRELGQDYKLDVIENEARGDQVISCYRTGDYLDVCRGPHVADAGEIRGLKLLRVAGAYWRADEKNTQLTRIYGTAWPSPEELEDYLRALREAEQRDHKKLGPQLGIYKLDPRAGLGNVLWLPNGATIRRELERWIVDEELDRGYQHVVTPVVGNLDLYRQSGHLERYADSMFPPMRTEDGGELQLRPMNCPHHILVYESEPRSYRDLPFRVAEIGGNYRWEKSGELMGMIRVRSFALNDAHIFCTPEQLPGEIADVIRLARHFMAVLGVTDYRYRLSVRDRESAKYAGGDEEWASAERALAGALESLDEVYELGRGDAAFYGPKIDFQVRDAQRREFTNSTVQVDFQMPERFGLEYTAADGSKQRPVMVHRGAFGAMERMVAYLIEQYAGAFPTWLHPVQVAVLPISEASAGYAREVVARLRIARVRVLLDDGPDRIGRKIRDLQRQRVPYMAVVGEREAESGEVSVRNRAGDQREEGLEDFLGRLLVEIAERRR